MSILEVDHVTLRMGGKKILDDLTIDFWEGHIHALCGPNGAGKSTLANTVMGLSEYTDFDGDIRLRGESLRGMPVDERARRGITLGWQEPARFEGLRVDSFIMAGAKEKKRSKVKEVLETVGLDPKTYMSRAVDKTLSGGERKRIELASILAMEPQLVLLDEPDSGIDVAALEQIFDSVRELKKRGVTVVMITHSAAVLKQSEHAFLLCNGQLIDKGDVSRIDQYFEDKCLPCDHINEPDQGEVA